jgi:transcriptional regulator with XRE-family HTH domain
LSASQVAALSGVSTSTVTRIEKGQVDPSFSTFEAILAACGYRYGDYLRPFVDMDAVRAARRIVEPELRLAPTTGSETYAQRWTAAGIITEAGTADEAENALVAASRQASLSDRPGAKRYGYADWKKVARALRDSGRTWGLTGGCAALAFTRIASVNSSAFYVDDVDAAAEAAGLEDAGEGRAWVTLIPLDDVTRAGLTPKEGGVVLADFWQVAIDCLAGSGRMPAQGEAMLASALR